MAVDDYLSDTPTSFAYDLHAICIITGVKKNDVQGARGLGGGEGSETKGGKGEEKVSHRFGRHLPIHQQPLMDLTR